MANVSELMVGITSDVVVSRVVVGLLVKIMNSSYGFFKEENRFEGMFG
jgi:hypothetical protein